MPTEQPSLTEKPFLSADSMSVEGQNDQYLYIANGFKVQLGYFMLQLATIVSGILIFTMNMTLGKWRL